MSYLIHFTLLFLATSSPLLASASPKVLCVDANAVTATPNGSCWAHPYLSLEHALERARHDKKVKEIWIADGVYRPSKTYTPKDAAGNDVVGGAMSLPQYNPGITIYGELKDYQDNVAAFNQALMTFDLIDSVNIYGGFQGQSHIKGGEKSIQERSQNVSDYPTILDGDLDGNPATPDNVWHVLTVGNDITLAGATLILDRLTVRNGNAIDAPYYPHQFPLESGQAPIYYHDDGGGLYIFAKSQATLKDIVFENNSAVVGGAIYAQDGTTLTIYNSQFKNNFAYGGGGITVRGGGPNELTYPTSRVTLLNIYNSHFEGNEGSLGIAVFTEDVQFSPPPGFSGAKITISDCTFLDHNQPENFGTLTLLKSESKIVNSTFKNNETFLGSAMLCDTGSFSFVNNTVRNNRAVAGGAIFAGFCNGNFINNLFQDNQAFWDGGAILLTQPGSYTFTNNTFLFNIAKYGGAIALFNDVKVTLTNNKFESNQAEVNGGAIFQYTTANAMIEKDINNSFLNNLPNDLGEE